MPANIYRQSEYLAISTAGKGKEKVVSMPQSDRPDISGSSDGELSFEHERNKTTSDKVIELNFMNFIIIPEC
jgi:hypothetical protein